MTVIEIPDEQAAALESKAASLGLSLAAWFATLASGPGSTSLDWSKCPAVEAVPGKMSGAWVLKGTRMPVSVIFENLEAGANIDDIMTWYQGLDRQSVKAVIDFAARSLERPLSR